MDGEAPTGRSQEPAKPARDKRRDSIADRPRERRSRRLTPGGGPTGEPKERRGGFVRFVQESAGELRKVEWPTQKQLLSATLAVIVACVVVGAFLFAADEAFRRLVRDVLLAG